MPDETKKKDPLDKYFDGGGAPALAPSGVPIVARMARFEFAPTSVRQKWGNPCASSSFMARI